MLRKKLLIPKKIRRSLSQLRHVSTDRWTLNMLGGFGAETFVAVDRDIQLGFVERLGLSVSIEFRCRTVENDIFEEEQQLSGTLCMEGISVPLIYREDLLLQHTTLLALDSLAAVLPALQQRLQMIRQRAERIAEWIGNGAKLHDIAFSPMDIHGDYTRLLREPLLVTFEFLESNLSPGIMGFSIDDADHLRAEAEEIRPVQAQRAAAKRRRLARGDGRVEADPLALAILRAADLKGRELVQSGSTDGECYTLVLPDVTVENIKFVWADGRQDVYFDFDGGRYAPGELLVWHQFPETILISIVGKRLNEVVEGELFRGVDAVITDASAFGSGTILNFDPEPVWI